MTTSALIMLLITWGVVIFFALRFFRMVWKMNSLQKGEEDEE